MSLQESLPWADIARTWGFLGVFGVVALVLIVAALRVFKTLIISTIDDARKDRDYSRQLREKEVGQFLEALKRRDETMEKGFDEVVQSLQDLHRRR